MKQKPCSLAVKHKWQFVRNVTLKKINIGPTGSMVRFFFKGFYKCDCGATRYGIQRDEVAL